MSTFYSFVVCGLFILLHVPVLRLIVLIVHLLTSWFLKVAITHLALEISSSSEALVASSKTTSESSSAPTFFSSHDNIFVVVESVVCFSWSAIAILVLLTLHCHLHLLMRHLITWLPKLSISVSKVALFFQNTVLMCFIMSTSFCFIFLIDFLFFAFLILVHHL